jgi:uncharacterized protein YcbX
MRVYVSKITVYPVKAFDGVELEAVTITSGGALRYDREYAFVREDGKYMNAKRHANVHRVRSIFSPDMTEATFSADGHTQTFHLEQETSALTTWMSEVIGVPLSLRRNMVIGMPDDDQATGPTIVAESTYHEVARWFPGLTADDMRGRFRANIEIQGDDVPAFWEDHLYDEESRLVPFRIGDILFHGMNPCRRCIVPTRDHRTGEEMGLTFKKHFSEQRQALLPSFATAERFSDTYYRLTVNTIIPISEAGKILRLGDELIL